MHPEIPSSFHSLLLQSYAFLTASLASFFLSFFNVPGVITLEEEEEELASMQSVHEWGRRGP
jgi:hypothetical protein